MFMANAEIKMEALTSHIARQKNIKRVYLINQDYQFGHQVRQFAREMLARKRPDVVMVGDDLHPLGKVKDFSPYVAKMKAARTDAIITGNWGQDMSLLVKAAKDAGLGAAFFTYYGGGPGAPTAMGDAAIGRVRTIWRWHKNMPTPQEQQAALEYGRRFGLEYYGMPLNNLLEMLTQAVNRAGSTDAVRVAYALEDMRIQGPLGEIWMRPDDHQLFEPLFIMVAARVDGKELRYDMEGTGIGPRTEARIEAADLKLPTLCRMQRPPRP
jgi:branched-chain amino acid transport system substrate-binding protein